jgi:hypothetical protein
MATEGNRWHARWVEWMDLWQSRADQAGLAGVAEALREGLRPLAPLAAQVLWVAQPSFALFGEADAISALADLLEHPEPALDGTPTESA